MSNLMRFQNPCRSAVSLRCTPRLRIADCARRFVSLPQPYHQQAFLIHDLYQLLFYSGIFVKFKNEIGNNDEGDFIKDWSRIKVWNSSWRYSIDKCSEQKAREFINSCERIIKWIQEN